MAFIEVIIPVPATTAPSGAWVPSTITKILNVTPEGATAGDTYYVYGSPNNTGTTAGKDAELVATIVVTSTETQVTLSTLVTNRPGPAFQYYAVVLGAGSGGGGKQVVVSGIDETAPPVGGAVTANQGTPNAGGALAWPVAASQVGPWSVAAAQGTSPWVVSGTVTSNQGGAPWSVAFPSAQHVIVDSVTGHLAVDQGTSPWVVSGTVTANQGGAPWSVAFPSAQHVIVDSVTGHLAVDQGTSPWVVSGTVTANQGGAPWSVAFPSAQHVIVDSVTGTIGVTQGTSPWVVSGTVAVTQSTSPWVTSVNNFPASQQVTQGTSPWVVSGTVAVTQSTSPWVTSVNNFPASQQVTQGTSPWVVSGTVTANVGTTGGLALDATLTGGTAKTIVRGGAKGVTPAADVTSTASGADHQALDVALYDAAGNLLGTSARPLRVDPTGTTTQPVSGTVAVTQSTSPWVTSVNNFPASQQVTQGTSPWVVSGTVTANQGTPAAATNAWPVTTVAGTPATYSASTNGTVATGTASGTTQSIAYLFHPNTNTKRVKILKITLCWSGNGGNNSLTARGTFITAENAVPGGATFAPQAHDQADAASTLTNRVGATGAPTRAASDLFAVAMIGGSSDQRSIVLFDAQTVGKPLILRASVNEGFEVRTVIGGANLASAVNVSVYFTWTEE